MKFFIFFLTLFLTASPVFSDDFSDALNAKYNTGLIITGDKIIFADDFVGTIPTPAEIGIIVSAYNSIENTKARRLAEIKKQAVERFKGYELYADMQSVIDYKAALRAVPTTAATEIAVLPDVASVKNYQPTWPAKPNL